MTLLCKLCLKVKPLNQFSNQKNRCKECMASYQRTNYAKSKQDIKKFVFDYLMEKGCEVCQETNPTKLEFDHLDPKDKKFNIGKMTIGKSKSLKDVQLEISKCRVVCSSCHKEHTHKTINSWKYKMWVEYQERNKQDEKI